MALSSHTNPVLANLRDEIDSLSRMGFEHYKPVISVRTTLSYLTENFGAAALNDGFYSAEEIEHARKVLVRYSAFV